MTENYYLKINDKGLNKKFEADEVGITRLKLSFLKETSEFLFLRKGEDIGGIFSLLFEVLSNGQEYIEAINNSYSEIVDISNIAIENIKNYDWEEFMDWYLRISKGAEFSKKQIKSFKDIFTKDKASNSETFQNKDIRILCNPNINNENARTGWEKGISNVRHYKTKKEAGSMRFYLNEKRYAVFFRISDNRFFGFTGNDKDTIERLKVLFEAEWMNSKIPPIKN